MSITLRQESATGATTKGSALTYAELDNNFIHLLRQGSVTVRGDSGTDQTLGEADKDSILQIAGGTDISTTLSSDSAGETVVTIAYTGSDSDTTYTIAAETDGSNANLVLTGSDASTDAIQLVAGTGITLAVDSAGAITIDGSSGGISNVVEDTTPQLGGDLDLNSNDITGTGDVNITGSVVAQSTLNAQTGTTYTPVLGDASKLITLSNASAITLTIPPNSSVAYPVGTKLDLAQIGAGQVTVAEGSGVTVNSTPTLKLRAQYSAATCIKTATDTWLLVGDLAES